MCCSSRASVPGQRRVARPQGPRAQTVKRKWIVTYRKAGETVTREYEGGRSQELAAQREAALNRGSIRMVTTRIPPKTTQTTAEKPKPVKKTAAKKATTRKGAAK